MTKFDVARRISKQAIPHSATVQPDSLEKPRIEKPNYRLVIPSEITEYTKAHETPTPETYHIHSTLLPFIPDVAEKIRTITIDNYLDKASTLLKNTVHLTPFSYYIGGWSYEGSNNPIRTMAVNSALETVELARMIRQMTDEQVLIEYHKATNLQLNAIVCIFAKLLGLIPD